MKKMITALFLLMLSVFVFAQSFPEDLKPAIEQVLEDARSNYNLKGNAATVILADGSTWSTASGIINNAQKPVDPARPFRFASYTKLLTSIIIMQFHEEGKLNINDPIGNYLDPLPHVDSTLTIKELLQQTTTIGNFFSSIMSAVQFYPDSIHQVEATLINHLPEPVNPQKNYNYCDSNHQILGLIIEKIIGSSAEEEYKKRLFDPLGLKNAWLAPIGFLNSDINGTWYNFGGTLYDLSTLSNNSLLTANKYNAGVIGTTEDMLRILIALFEGAYLQPETLEIMKVESPSSQGAGYGYGHGLMRTTINEDVLYGHGGGIATSTRTYYCPAKKIGLSVAINQDNTTAVNYMLDEVYKAASTFETAIDPESTPAVPGSFSLNNYPNPFNPQTTITYRLTGNQAVELTIYDVLGKKVATLVEGRQSAGEHSVTFRVVGLPSGIYFYILKAGEESHIRKMILAK